MITIAEHTLSEITIGGKVLDVGSRNYAFASQMAKYGCEVYAIEPDDSVSEPADSGIHLIRTALVSKENAGKTQKLVKWSTGEGNHLDSIHGDMPASHTKQDTTCHSIEQISKMAGIGLWDMVKLDCEGAEFEILLNWPGPIAKQITVEFHDFCGANLGGDETHKKIIEHLSQWYDVVQHEKSVRYSCGVPNYWDSLFVLKRRYKGKIGFVVGSGCSLRHVNPELLNGHTVIAVNGAILKFPDADYWFSCDARATLRKSWLAVKESNCKIIIGLGGSDFDCYDDYRGEPFNKGIEDRITYLDRDMASGAELKGDKLICGSSSAHCAVHFAHNLGCSTIVLLGMDCCFEGGKQRFTDFDSEPDDGLCKEEFKQYIAKENNEPIIEMFKTTWEQIAKANPDIDIINASGGELEAFERMKIEEILDQTVCLI